MAQRFPGGGPSPGPPGPMQQQRYNQPQNTALPRQYAGPNFPVSHSCLFVEMMLLICLRLQGASFQRHYFNNEQFNVWY